MPVTPTMADISVPQNAIAVDYSTNDALQRGSILKLLPIVLLRK